MDNKILSAIIVIIVIIISSLYGGHIADSNDTGNITGNSTVSVMEDGQYTSMEDVSAYIKKYHKLPSNYITKEEARDLGWTGGSLEPYAPGKSIGGDEYKNYDKQKTDLIELRKILITNIGEQMGVVNTFLHNGLLYYIDNRGW